MSLQTMPPQTMSATRQQMSDPVASGWEKLFSIARKEVDDRQVLERQLARWCDAHGVDGALFTEVDGVGQKLIQIGSTHFPEKLPAAGDDGEWTRVELPEAQLLHTGTSGPARAHVHLQAITGDAVNDVGRRVDDWNGRLQVYRFAEGEICLDDPSVQA